MSKQIHAVIDYPRCLNCGEPFTRTAHHPEQKCCSHRCARFVAAKTLRVQRPPEERFWKRVDKSGECWLWQGGTSSGMGYGHVADLNKHIQAHRFSYELHFGPIPDGLFVCHNCPGGDNPRCVRPEHLFLGTHKDNMEDMTAKGRRTRGSASPSAKLNEVDVVLIRELHANGWRKFELANRFNVAGQTIRRIVNGTGWKHVPSRMVG